MSNLILLLSLRNARLYMIAMLLSFFGDGVLTVAASVWVKTLTGSNSAATLVTFFIFIPIACSPAAGFLADRIDKRRLLVVTNSLSALLLVFLAAVGGRDRVWAIFIVMALYGASYVVVSTAEPALFSSILPDRALAEMNSVRIAMQEGCKVLAPLIGAILFAALGAPLVSIATSCCFFVAAAMNQIMRIPSNAAFAQQSKLKVDLTTGFAYLWRNIHIRRVVMTGGAALFISGLTQAAIFALMAQGLHRSPTFLGVLASFQGAGSVAGGAAASTLMRRYGEANVAGIGIVAYSAGAALLIPAHLASAFVGMTLLGAGPLWLIVSAMTLMQRCTPVQIQGRVFGGVTLLLYLPQAASLALGAALIAEINYKAILTFEVVCFVFLACNLFIRTRVSPAGLGLQEGETGGVE